MKRLLSEELIAMKYKEYQGGKRAQEIADELGFSVQHILRSFRKHEGLPVWSKNRITACPGKVQSSAFRKKGFRNDFYEEEPYNERTNTYTHGAKRVDAGIYSDK